MYTFILNDYKTVTRCKCNDRGFSELQTSLHYNFITASSLCDVTSLHTSFRDVPAVGVDHVAESAGNRPARVPQGLLGNFPPGCDDSLEQGCFRVVGGFVNLCLHEAPKTEVCGVEVGTAGRPLVWGDERDLVLRESGDGGPGGVAGCAVLLVKPPLAMEVPCAGVLHLLSQDFRLINVRVHLQA